MNQNKGKIQAVMIGLGEFSLFWQEFIKASYGCVRLEVLMANLKSRRDCVVDIVRPYLCYLLSVKATTNLKVLVLYIEDIRQEVIY